MVVVTSARLRSPEAARDLYARLIVAQIPRVLGLMDREPLSPTAGCADRTYWAWKFVDFPRSRFQEALCVMAFLHSTPIEGSSCYRHPQLLEWIASGMRFWSSLQHDDGSFDEAYPFERSLAATAFTTFYVGEAFAFVHDVLPGDVRDSVRRTVERAGDWLVNNDETHGLLSNHLAAAAGALAQAHRITGHERFAARREHFLARILAHQSSEGWYEEYGGADPGYQTHGSFYMARCWQLTGSDALRASILRSMAFLAHCIHPDGSIGGEYASRNTQTYYPAAFEMLAPHDGTASWIAGTMRASVGGADAAGLAGIDSYNYFPFLNNLVFAYLAASAGTINADPVEPSSDQPLVWFPDAGLARIRTSRYDAYVGASKGGVIKVFDRRQRTLTYSDCGYIGRTGKGALASTQHLDRRRPVRLGPGYIELDSPFVRFSRPTMTPFMFLGFRGFTTTIGRLPRLARWLKMKLVKTLVYRQETLPCSLTRRIEFDDEGITVRDRLEASASNDLRDVRWGSRFATIHMGSSRYFVNHELDAVPAGDVVALPAAAGRVEVVRRIVVPAADHAGTGVS
jgi:hypothetical protein